MSNSSIEAVARSKISRALHNLTTQERIRVLADVMRNLGMNHFSALLLDTLDDVTRSIR